MHCCLFNLISSLALVVSTFQDADDQEYWNAEWLRNIVPYLSLILVQAQQAKSRAEKLTAKRTSGASKEEVKKAGEVHYKTMISDSDYTEFDVFQKWLGVSQ